MANSLKGEVEIPVAPAQKGGPKETLTLVFDWDAWVALEELLDKSILEILVALNQGVRLKLVHALFWAGLRAKHPQIDLDAAKALIPRCGGAFGLFEKIGAGIERAFPKPGAEEAADDADPQEPAATSAGDCGTKSPNTASGSGSSTD